jgi:hypothetical protein
MLHIVLLVAATVLEGQVQLPPPNRPATDGKAKAAAERKVAPESLEVRYARAQLKLAEANLSRVQQSNQQMERTVPSSIVAEYQDDVRVAKMQLQQVTSGASAGDLQVWLERATAEKRDAATVWQKATAANRSVPNTFAEIDVERYRLRAEVAKLLLERGQSLVNADREAQLQWQAELLDNQVQRLKEDNRDGAQLIGLYPRWWW